MGGSKKTGVRRSIERLLIPELVARGFERVPPVQDAQLSPFGRLRRRGERGLDLIEIRFNKDRTSHFHFYIARATGESTIWRKPVPIEDQWPIDVKPSFLVWRRGRVFRHWFGVKKYAREGITEQEYDDAVRVAIAYVPMIERYFLRGTRTLAMEKFPQGITDDLAYWGLCAGVILGPVFLAIWTAGWVVRNLLRWFGA